MPSKNLAIYGFGRHSAFLGAIEISVSFAILDVTLCITLAKVRPWPISIAEVGFLLMQSLCKM